MIWMITRSHLHSQLPTVSRNIQASILLLKTAGTVHKLIHHPTLEGTRDVSLKNHTADTKGGLFQQVRLQLVYISKLHDNKSV